MHRVRAPRERRQQRRDRYHVPREMIAVIDDAGLRADAHAGRRSARRVEHASEQLDRD